MSLHGIADRLPDQKCCTVNWCVAATASVLVLLLCAVIWPCTGERPSGKGGGGGGSGAAYLTSAKLSI